MKDAFEPVGRARASAEGSRARIAKSRLDGVRVDLWLNEVVGADPEGRVLSWYNPDHPGYEYPEAAAMWLLWACRVAELPTESREPVARRLAEVALRGCLDPIGARTEVDPVQVEL